MPTAEEAAIAAKLKQKGLPTEEIVEDEPVTEVEEEQVEVEEEEEAEEAEVEETESPEEPSEEEQVASAAGWRPEDEWDGAPEDWVSAREFNRRGEYLRKIHNQNRKIKQLDDVVATLANQQKKIFEAGYAKAKRELRAELREATKEGDDSQVEAIEEQLETLEKQRQEDVAAVSVQTAPAQPPVAPEFTAWVQRNQWFITNPALRGYAETIGTKHATDNPHKTNVEIYQYVTAEVKKRFPEEFGAVTQPKKKSGSPVVGGANLTSSGRSGAAQTVRVALTSEEKAVGRALVDKGIYANINEYATDLKKFGVKNK